MMTLQCSGRSKKNVCDLEGGVSTRPKGGQECPPSKTCCKPHLFKAVLTVTFVVLMSIPEPLHALGTGWYAIKVKVEHQYSDYNAFTYPKAIPPVYPGVVWQQFDPYIVDFPENRTLVRITQTFGPLTAVQMRYQFSKMTDTKDQRLIFAQIAREIHPLFSVYANGQFLNQPDLLKAWAGTLGGIYNNAGWIIADISLGYNLNHPVIGATGLTADQASNSRTWSPIVSVRYALDSRSAAQLRWEGYFASTEGTSRQSHAVTGTVSHHFPTSTALHLSGRWFDSDVGIASISPGFEVAQYIAWNLVGRLSYRYYDNEYDDPEAVTNISGSTIISNSLSAAMEYGIRPDLKVHMKYRRYESNQSIRMNTYLAGCEWTL